MSRTNKKDKNTIMAGATSSNMINSVQFLYLNCLPKIYTGVHPAMKIIILLVAALIAIPLLTLANERLSNIASCRETFIVCSENYPSNCTEYNNSFDVVQKMPDTVSFGRTTYWLSLVTEHGEAIYACSNCRSVYSSIYGTITLSHTYGQNVYISCGVNGTFIVGTGGTFIIGGGAVVDKGNIIGNVLYIYPGYAIERVLGVISNNRYVVSAVQQYGGPKMVYILDGEEARLLPNSPLYPMLACNAKMGFTVVGSGIGVYNHNGVQIDTMIQGSVQHPWTVRGCAPDGFYITRGSDTNLSSIEYYQL